LTNDIIFEKVSFIGRFMQVKRIILDRANKIRVDMKKIKLEQVFFSLSNPIRRNIVELLGIGINKHLMEIVKELGIDDHTKVAFHLRVLKTSGIIEQGKEKSYSLTNGGEKILDSLKVLENYFSE